MNRIQPPLGKQATPVSYNNSSSKPSPDVLNVYKSLAPVGRLSQRSEPTPRAIFSPLHYESGYAYPLVVWLHGPGDDERQLRRIMPLVSLRNYVAIAPRGTQAVENDSERSFKWAQTEQQIDNATESIIECIEFAQDRFHIAASRVFLAGYRSGGTMAIRLAFQFPEQFAGVISFAGPFPQGLNPLRRVNALRTLPLLLTMGRKSQCYSETQLCHDLRLAHAAGLSVSVRQYPCGDELTTAMLTDSDRWIMGHVCGTAADSP